MIVGINEYMGKYDFSNFRENLYMGDVHVFELEVLKGDDFTLDKMDHAFFGINSDKLYADSSAVDEINSLLSTKEFTPWKNLGRWLLEHNLKK
jgi:hypothetical protein